MKQESQSNATAGEALDLIANTQRGLIKHNVGPLWMVPIVAVGTGVAMGLEASGWLSEHGWASFAFFIFFGWILYLLFQRTGVRHKRSWRTLVYCLAFAFVFVKSIAFAKQFVAAHGDIYAWYFGIASGLAVLMFFLVYRWYATKRSIAK